MKTLIYISAIFLFLFLVLEGGCYFYLKYSIDSSKFKKYSNSFFYKVTPTSNFQNFLKKKSEYYVFHPILGVKFKPYSDIFGLSPDSNGNPYFDQSISLRTDATGYVSHSSHYEELGGDRHEKKVYTILISGGSTVAGWGASTNENTWPAILENELNKSMSGRWSKFNFRVINTGVFGYSLFQEILNYLHETRFLNPDLIISFNGINEKWNFENSPQLYSISYQHEELMNALRGMHQLNIYGFVPNIKLFLKLILNKSLWEGEDGTDHSYAKRMTGDRIYQKEVLSYRALAKGDNVNFLHVLQPAMGVCDKKLTTKEERLKNYFGNQFYRSSWDSWQSYSRNINDFYNKIRNKLDKRWQIDLSCLFQKVRAGVYHDPRHYNDIGQKLIAFRMSEIIKERFLK